MIARIYVEGGATGANSKRSDTQCRENFQSLLTNCGFAGHKPRVVPCGSRDAVFRAFKYALMNLGSTVFVAMLIDSEDPVSNVEKTWDHLKKRDPSWTRPAGTTDEQVFFMTTCMETWIIADREAIRRHFHGAIRASALPKSNLESRNRHDIQSALLQATNKCFNPYKKGDFAILAKLNPATLDTLPSFARIRRILNKRLH